MILIDFFVSQVGRAPSLSLHAYSLAGTVGQSRTDEAHQTGGQSHFNKIPFNLQSVNCLFA